MNLIITEDIANKLKENKNYENFNNEIRNFIYNIITNNSNNISDYWGLNGLKKSLIFRKLKSYGIIVKIDDEFKAKKNNFDNKIKWLYNELFSDETPAMIMSEDGEGLGGTSTGSVGGDYVTAFSSEPIKRTIKI